jgi:hypothetical protein
MPMVNLRSGTNPSQEALAQGAAGLGAFVATNLIQRRLNRDRTDVEQRIGEAGTFQDALSVIESAPFKVKNAFHDELLERARARFPEQELLSVLTPEGEVRQITQEKGRPLTSRQIEEQGFLPATQHLIVSTDPKSGEIEIHDTALGMQAAGEELERFQEMFPDRTFQVTQAPETETFMAIKDQQLRARQIAAQRSDTDKVTPQDAIFWSTVHQEMQNDPLVTEQGAAVMQGARDDIIQRFKDFNGTFASGVFSLDNPESAALVQNGIAITSQLVGRGLSQEKAADIGFNSQIANNVVRNLLNAQALDNGVVRETARRFGVDPQALHDAVQAAASSPDFREMAEYDPKSGDPDVLDVPVNTQAGSATIRFAKVNGKLVPLGKR